MENFRNLISHQNSIIEVKCSLKLYINIIIASTWNVHKYFVAVVKMLRLFHFVCGKKET